MVYGIRDIKTKTNLLLYDLRKHRIRYDAQIRLSCLDRRKVTLDFLDAVEGEYLVRESELIGASMKLQTKKHSGSEKYADFLIKLREQIYESRTSLDKSMDLGNVTIEALLGFIDEQIDFKKTGKFAADRYFRFIKPRKAESPFVQREPVSAFLDRMNPLNSS